VAGRAEKLEVVAGPEDVPSEAVRDASSFAHRRSRSVLNQRCIRSRYRPAVKRLERARRPALLDPAARTRARRSRGSSRWRCEPIVVATEVLEAGRFVVLVMERRFALGAVLLGLTVAVALVLGDTPAKEGVYAFPMLVGTWLLWAPMRALFWGEGLEEVDEDAASRALEKTNAARALRTADLARVDRELSLVDAVYHDHFGIGLVTGQTTDADWVLIEFDGEAGSVRMSPKFTSLWWQRSDTCRLQ